MRREDISYKHLKPKQGDQRYDLCIELHGIEFCGVPILLYCFRVTQAVTPQSAAKEGRNKLEISVKQHPGKRPQVEN